MKTRFRFVCLVCSVLFGSAAAPQDLIITGGKIIDGAGRILEDGSVVIRDGRIESVTAEPITADGVQVIDAAGMTVMPGLIDTHRHVIGGGEKPIDSEAALAEWLDEQAPERMREFLAAGFTTILSAGDPTAGILELKRRLTESEISGPQLLVSGSRIVPASPEEVDSCRRDEFCRQNRSLISSYDDAREQVKALADAGVDAIKIRLDSEDPTGVDKETAAVIAEEAKRQGIPSIVHATAVSNMIAAVEAGISRLVHTPHTEPLLGTNAARLVMEAAVPLSTTLGVWVPIFSETNETLWRNGSPFPPAGIARAGQGQANARYLWDAGALFAFGTDTGFHPSASLKHELRALSLLFSPQDIIAMITRNAAMWLELDDQTGTLEPGKEADLVVIDGDPLANIHDLSAVRMVISNGKLVQINLR